MAVTRLTVFLENLALSIGDAVNVSGLDLSASCEQTLPPGDRVGTNNGTAFGPLAI
jgi:hypothetical protein